jgi:hypothetical protein
VTAGVSTYIKDDMTLSDSCSKDPSISDLCERLEILADAMEKLAMSNMAIVDELMNQRGFDADDPSSADPISRKR